LIADHADVFASQRQTGMITFSDLAQAIARFVDKYQFFPNRIGSACGKPADRANAKMYLGTDPCGIHAYFA